MERNRDLSALKQWLNDELVCNNLTHAAFAYRCNVSQSAIRRILNDPGYYPGLDLLAGLAKGTCASLPFVLSLVYPEEFKEQPTSDLTAASAARYSKLTRKNQVVVEKMIVLLLNAQRPEGAQTDSQSDRAPDASTD